MGVETLPNALGGKAYVHLVALGTEDAVNEGFVHAGEGLCEGIRRSMEWSRLEGVGVLVGLLSPRCWRGWGFSGSRPGVAKGRGWRGRDRLK